MKKVAVLISVIICLVANQVSAQTNNEKNTNDSSKLINISKNKSSHLIIKNRWSSSSLRYSTSRYSTSKYSIFIKISGTKIIELPWGAAEYFNLAKDSSNKKQTFDFSISVGDKNHFVDFSDIAINTDTDYVLTVINPDIVGVPAVYAAEIGSDCLLISPNSYTVQTDLIRRKTLMLTGY